ncbi:MAG: hypothetical protein Q9219_003431 [cf. Caloplaca sp. 3 TL-2023]
MATIKAIQGHTVHQIQSGQVIVDLCSVVKELVENSLDADATSIEVRFKGNGLESIEIQDNGTGISAENYPTIALKHYTSKLSTYDDLSSLQTFGFRGEALSSLCALSTFQIITAQAAEAPKGTKLEFETSGKLRSTSVVASQKGTTITVERLFANLPVRRRELEKNIKREYGKVLGLLQAYACISTSVKFAVSNVMVKGKKSVVFATKSNATTRENIANVFGAKALPALLQMDLDLEMHNSTKADQPRNPQVRVLGHVSRPVLGEGRQTPDRQMFFVNARPCSLPQFAKVFNEVYKSYNMSQSPFVFANILLDTNAYDVNVSPDKRTILLHEQTAMLESLRSSLTELFENQDQTMPQTQLPPKLPNFKQPSVHRQGSGLVGSMPFDDHETQPGSSTNLADDDTDEDLPNESEQSPRTHMSLTEKFAGRDAQSRPAPKDEAANRDPTASRGKQKLLQKLGDPVRTTGKGCSVENSQVEEGEGPPPDAVADFNKRIAEQQATADKDAISSSEKSDREAATDGEEDITAIVSTRPNPSPGVVPNAFDRMRPRRQSPQVATITIGTKTTTAVLGSSPPGLYKRRPNSPATSINDGHGTKFGSSMRAFKAPGGILLQTQTPNTPAELSPIASSLQSSTRGSPNYANSSSGYDSEGEPNVGQSVDSDEEISTPGCDNQSPTVEDSDDEYLDERGRKAKQDAKVATLIQQAEEQSVIASKDNLKRANYLLQGKGLKQQTTQLLQTLHESVANIERRLRSFERDVQKSLEDFQRSTQTACLGEVDPEQKLSLTVSREDFSRMNIIGQFNLGFILAVRPSTSATTNDELFIIDQHASDEKYNFERLQASTTVQNQRLVKPKTLDLTAIEEEIIIENHSALIENGFVIDVDESGDAPVGQRCRLLSLPMSRDVTFDLSDLEELVALLGESPSATATVNKQDSDNNNKGSSNVEDGEGDFDEEGSEDEEEEEVIRARESISQRFRFS